MDGKSSKWGIGFLRAVIPLLLLLAIPVCLIVFIRPAIGASVCPRCFGFSLLQGDIYVERNMTADERSRVVSVMAEAGNRVSKFFGSEKHRPRTLVCATQACFSRLGGGGARVGSLGSLVLMVSPQGIDPVLIAHELAQTELVGRIGLLKYMTGAVPAWYEQGVDVIVSDDPAYILPKPWLGDRCKADPSGDLPDDMVEWVEQANDNQGLYAKAACRVDRWMISHGGAQSVVDLVAGVSKGKSFEQLFETHGK